jgi:hypothetical protein
LLNEYNYDRGVLVMSDSNERIEEDYYAGYYWGRNPYDSEYLSTEKTDDELKNKVLQNLQRNSIYSDAIIVVSTRRTCSSGRKNKDM